MYYINKRMLISASHKLALSYASKCENLHGHNWIITLFCRAEKLSKDGMVVDFTDIKKEIENKLDHKLLNEELSFNPTAENIAKWCVEQVPTAYKCEVQETEGNNATYER